jgi:hypothetical protein
MSSIGFTDAPQLDTNASEAKVGQAYAPRSNGALELASALGDLNPKLQALGATVVREDQQVQHTAAKQRAIELGGQSIADAVRTGKMEKTSNPFFIQDYNRESAYIRAQGDISELRVQSQTWEEQGDPTKFQERYLKEIGAIGQKYGTDPDTMHGFGAAAEPAIQQDFAANTASKVADIKADHISVGSNLVAQTIAGVQTAKGGVPTPDDVFSNEKFTQQKAQFLSTGGSNQEWDKLVTNGVTAAALSQHNASLLDILKDPKSGTAGALYNSPGAAEAIETTRYRIVQDQQAKGKEEYYQAQQADYLSGRAAQQALYEKYGIKAFTGGVPADDMIATLKDKGLSIAGITGALNKAQASTADYQSISEAGFRTFANTQDGHAEIFDLHMQAQTKGYSPEFEQQVSNHVLHGDIAPDAGAALVRQAIATTGGQSPMGLKKPSIKNMLNSYDRVGTLTDSSVSQTTAKLNKNLHIQGKPSISSSEIQGIQRDARATAKLYLDVNPGDYPGASNEAEKVIASRVKLVMEKHLKQKAH